MEFNLLKIAIKLWKKIGLLALLTVAAFLLFQAFVNYYAGFSGPFDASEHFATSPSRVEQFRVKMDAYFSSEKSQSEVNSYLQSIGFKCRMINKFRADENTNGQDTGSVLNCVYRYGGFLFLLPDALILRVHFNENSMSSTHELMVESV